MVVKKGRNKDCLGFSTNIRTIPAIHHVHYSNNDIGENNNNNNNNSYNNDVRDKSFEFEDLFLQLGEEKRREEERKGEKREREDGEEDMEGMVGEERIVLIRSAAR
jgi:hypothetical protein